MNRDDASNGLIRALDVEIQIMADAANSFSWIEHPDEAEHWIYEIVQGVFKDVVTGVVEMDRHFGEPESYKQHLSVFAAPTPENTAVVQGDLRAIETRIQTDLCAKFSTTNPPPIVRVDPDPSFMGVQPGGGGELLVTAHHYDGALQGVPIPHASDQMSSADQSARPRARALMWTGAALGGMLIANIFLLSNNVDLRGRNLELTANSTNVMKLEAAHTQERFTWQSALSQKDMTLKNYTQAAIRHFDDLNKQIDDLASKKGLARPPVLTPPSPPTIDPFYEEPVDPFADYTTQE